MLFVKAILLASLTIAFHVFFSEIFPYCFLYCVFPLCRPQKKAALKKTIDKNQVLQTAARKEEEDAVTQDTHATSPSDVNEIHEFTDLFIYLFLFSLLAFLVEKDDKDLNEI